MATSRAFVVGIEEWLNPGFGAVPYARRGAELLSHAFATAGYPTADQILLLGPQATRAAVDSRLRKFVESVSPGDRVLVYWAGLGDARYLPCWDALADDLPGTSLALPDLFATLDRTSATSVTVLLEVGAGPEGRHLDADELERRAGDTANTIVLTASQPDDTAHAAAGLKAPVWTHILTEALHGRGRNIAGPDGSVSVNALFEHARTELPRIARGHLDTSSRQKPQRYGPTGLDFVIAERADPTPADPVGLLDPARLRRVVFRYETFHRVKDLTDWRKSFAVPPAATASAKKFVARVAGPDVQADLDAVLARCRDELGYRRKDVTASAESDGTGALHTPDFEYMVTVELDADDPSQVVWVRDVTGFTDPGFVRGPGFAAVFGPRFDRLVFEFTRPVDVPGLVDRLEDDPPDGLRVGVGADDDECEISLLGFAGRIVVRPGVLEVRGRAGDSAGLLDLFLAFLQRVGPVGDPPALGM